MPKTRPLKLEVDLLENLGAIPHANSGAMAKKHDGSTPENLFEIKTTRAASFSIKKEYFGQLKKRAIQRNLQPALVIAFDDGMDTAYHLDKVVVVDYEYFRELVNSEDYLDG